MAFQGFARMVGIQASGNTALHSLPGILSKPSAPHWPHQLPARLGALSCSVLLWLWLLLVTPVIISLQALNSHKSHTLLGVSLGCF